jgi:hypothetical protein
MKIIFDPATGRSFPYPRADNGPIIGLDPSLKVLDVIRLPIPDVAEGSVLTEAAPVDDLVAGTRTIGWDVQPPPPEPQWVQFAASLVPDIPVNQFIVSVAQAAPMLDRMLTVGMGQAAQGDPQTFMAAWTQARVLGLAPPELIKHMQGMAAGFYLPAEFIEGLAAELQPPP